MASPETPAATGDAQPSPESLEQRSSPVDESPPPVEAPSEEVEDSGPSPKRRKAACEDESAGDVKGPSNPFWKTSLCSYFRRQAGSCSHGAGCRYAHGEAELRPRPDNSWDPTSERAKRVREAEEGGAAMEVEDARENFILPESAGEFGDGDGPGDVELEKCLVNLPRKWDSGGLKSFLDTQGIIYRTAKKKKGMTVGFVSFETLEHVKNAMEELNGKSMGNKQIKVANVLPRSFVKKDKLVTPQYLVSVDQPSESNLRSETPEEEIEGAADKDTTMVNGLAIKTRSARDAVTPLAHIPYSDQLEHKKKSLSQALKKLTRSVRKACPASCPLPGWIVEAREIGGLPCKLEGIVESPLVNGYRNKCEFSVGYSSQGNRTVGFKLGNFREGIIAVEEPVDCPNVSRIACEYASIFQEFLQSSGFPLWNRIDNTGFWRQFTVREGRISGGNITAENADNCIAEVMLIVQVCSSGEDREAVKLELEKMVEAFVQGASSCSPPLPLSVLVVQDHKGISDAAPADCPLFTLSIPNAEGLSRHTDQNVNIEARIHDYISSLCFSISPTAFFQVNTLAAEKLYSLAGDWASLGPDTLLFDICCGTGTIGLTLAHRVGMVVGIEMNESAVSDANRNAEINGIRNCSFICSKAEDVIGTLLRKYVDTPSEDINLRVEDDETCDEEKAFEVVSGCSNDKSSSLPTTLGGLEAENCGFIKTCDMTTFNGPPHHEMAHGNHIIEDKSNAKVKDIGINTGIPSNSGGSGAPSQQFKNIVAIVDPPRGGLHPTVIKALRTHSRLRRLVYISCNPESLVANAIELCTPAPEKPDKSKNNRAWRKMSNAGLARHRAKSMPSSEPFRPVRAMAVDLFPHTLHCEMVMLLER